MNLAVIRRAAVVLLLAVTGPAPGADVPYLSGRIVDNAELLSPETFDRIGALLREHESRTGNQIAVLTTPSIEGESIEEFALKVFNTWKLGQKGKEILAAGSDVRARPPTPSSGSSAFPEPDLPLTERILVGAFIFGIIGLFTVLGVLTPGIGWFLYFFLIPFWAMFPIIVVGTDGALKLLVTYLVGFPVAKVLIARRPWYKTAQHDLRTKGKARIGGFTLGGSSGSSSSSWSSRSGGFSGGGGSSGGGGASGSW